jgi:hypothetical protein
MASFEQDNSLPPALELLPCSEEAISSSETSIDSKRTTCQYIPEDSTLHNHRYENLKSYRILLGHTFQPDPESLYRPTSYCMGPGSADMKRRK